MNGCNLQNKSKKFFFYHGYELMNLFFPMFYSHSMILYTSCSWWARMIINSENNKYISNRVIRDCNYMK